MRDSNVTANIGPKELDGEIFARMLIERVGKSREEKEEKRESEYRARDLFSQQECTGGINSARKVRGECARTKTCFL